MPTYHPLSKKHIQSEFQRMLACVCCDNSSDDDKMLGDRQELVFDAYHGLNGCSSQLGLLIEGVDSKYNMIYEEITDSTTNKTKKVVKAIYSPNRGVQELAVGYEMVVDNFVHATMQSKGQTLINGRKLINMSKATVGYVKKALAHASSFLDSNKQTPSGNNINDLLDYVLDEMWEEEWIITTSKKKSKQQQGDGNNVIEKKDRPKNWTFFGYVAFCMFACPLLTQPDDRLELFCPTGKKKKGKSLSRQESRKKMKKEKEKKRWSELATGNRGVSMDQSHHINSIVINNISVLQQQQSEIRKKNRDEMMVRSSHVREALVAKDQELRTADLFYKLGQPENALMAVQRAQQLSSFIDSKREETEQKMAQQQEEEKKMQDQNKKLDLLLQNVASSIVTNDNVVIDIDKESDDTSVIVLEGTNVDAVASTEEEKEEEEEGEEDDEEEEDDDEEDDYDGDMNGDGAGTSPASL